MNISKDFNLSLLRKTCTRIFNSVQGFWISMGILSLILIILFFVFVYPLSNKYAMKYQDMENLLASLDRYALKKDLYNGKWIASKKQEAELYDNEIEKCKSFLKGKDAKLEAVFSIEDPGKGLIQVSDEALWKNEYVRRVSALLEKLEAHNIVLGEGALPFHNWGLDIPTWNAILPVQKDFWILEALVKIALNDTGITKLEKIAFRESSYTYYSSLAHLYTAIPLTIKVELPADRIQFLLHNILQSDIPFVIEDITILSTNKISHPDATAGNGGGLLKDANNRISNPIIDVTIDAYVVDYKT